MKGAAAIFQYSTPLATSKLDNAIPQHFIFSVSEGYPSVSRIVNWFFFDFVLIRNATVFIISNIGFWDIVYYNCILVIGSIST